MAWEDPSAPSIPEMREMLKRPEGVDFHPLVSHHYCCSKCGAVKADWWMVMGRKRVCSACVERA